MLYYIHGLYSSPDSLKGVLFKEKLKAKPIKYRDLDSTDINIQECIQKIEKEIENDSDVTLIGSSFGGFLAAELAMKHSNVKNLILLNPAIVPPDVDKKAMKERILKEMFDPRLFKNKIHSNILILAGTKDEVVLNSWAVKFAMSQETTIRFLDDDHIFTKNLNQLPEIIEDFLNKKH